MRRDPIWTYALIVGVVALAGWVWAFSNADMPDVLWFSTVILTVVAVVLALYAVARGRRATSPR